MNNNKICKRINSQDLYFRGDNLQASLDFSSDFPQLPIPPTSTSSNCTSPRAKIPQLPLHHYVIKKIVSDKLIQIIFQKYFFSIFQEAFLPKFEDDLLFLWYMLLTYNSV